MAGINAGLAALRGSNNILNTTMQGMPDQTGLAILSKDIRNLENNATKKANNDARQGLLINQLVDKKIQAQKKLDKYVEKKYEPVKRMAGVLAGIDTIASTSLLISENNRLKKQQDILKSESQKLQNYSAELDANAKARGDSLLEKMNEMIEKTKTDLEKRKNEFNQSKSKSTSSDSTTSPASGFTSTLSGINKQVADYVAGGESGRFGYDAMNQGTDANKKIVGSGSFAKILGGGTPLTSLSLKEVIDKQSGYDDPSISTEEWRRRGGLHAAGRYQFIGPTLKNEIGIMGLDLDTKFTPEVQDKIFLHHLKRVGSFQPWEAVNKRSDRFEMEKLIPQITL